MKNEDDIRLSIKQTRKLHVLEEVTGGVITNREASAALELSVRQVQRIKTGATSFMSTEAVTASGRWNNGPGPHRGRRDDLNGQTFQVHESPQRVQEGMCTPAGKWVSP